MSEDFPRVHPPMRRFSSTVSGPKSSRPSGTCSSPRRTRSWVARASTRSSSNVIVPLVALTVPLMVLAALSVLGGLLLLGGWITEWLSPVVGEEEHHALPLPPIAYTLIVTAVVAAGVLVAWLFVAKRDIRARRRRRSAS